MKINKIVGALKGAKFGLILHSLHDNRYGRVFCGCGIGELLHAAGMNRRQIDRDRCTADSDDYSTIQDGILARVYGLDKHDIDQFHIANDNFLDPRADTNEAEQIGRRDYLIRWARAFHKLRKAGAEAFDAACQARDTATLLPGKTTP